MSQLPLLDGGGREGMVAVGALAVEATEPEDADADEAADTDVSMGFSGAEEDAHATRSSAHAGTKAERFTVGAL